MRGVGGGRFDGVAAVGAGRGDPAGAALPGRPGQTKGGRLGVIARRLHGSPQASSAAPHAGRSAEPSLMRAARRPGAGPAPASAPAPLDYVMLHETLASLLPRLAASVPGYPFRLEAAAAPAAGGERLLIAFVPPDPAVISRIQREHPRAAIVAISYGAHDPLEASQSLDAGADEYLVAATPEFGLRITALDRRRRTWAAIG